MKHFRAITEHGTVYLYQGGTIRVLDGMTGDHKDSVRPMSFSLVDRDELERIEAEEGAEAAWEYLRAAESADLPEVGKAMYITSFSNWRISTDVVSVEELE